jgi:ribosomal protein S4
LAFDKKELTITINSLPSNDEMPKNIETQLIIEFYSR